MHNKMPLFQHKIKRCNACTKDDNNLNLLNFSFIHFSKIALSSKRQKKKAGQEASYYAYLGGSFTLEMVVIMPLFICFMVLFLFLFRVLQVQECMEEALLYTSRTLAVACYEESAEKQKTEAELLAKAHLTLVSGLKESNCPMSFVEGGNLGISLLSSELTGDDIVLRASYKMKLPVTVFGKCSYNFMQCVQSRKWIGDTTLGNGSGDEKWVYITPNGRVYHLRRTCSYLDLSIQAVNRASVGAMRNASGGKYKRCESCGGAGSGMVYVTDYGDRYHSSLSCSGLKRTVYMVKISEVGGRGVCSKCGSS